MTRARTLADLISDGVIGTTELADDAITPVKLDASSSYTMDGLTLNGDLDLQDNDKILVGAGDDLQIYHDGNNSYINDIGTGNLLIRAADSLLIQDTGGKTYLKTVINAQTELSYNNSTKLATTSSGIDVDGTITTNDLLVVKTSPSTNTVGVEARSNGQLVATLDGGTALIANRKTSDGDVVKIMKDGSTVGVIGTQNWGVGTSSPTSYANSQSTLVVQDSGNPAIALSDTGQARDWYLIAFGDGLGIRYADGGGSGGVGSFDENVFFKNNGMMALGHSGPEHMLHIKGDSPTGDGASIQLEVNNNNSTDRTGIIRSGNNASNTTTAISFETVGGNENGEMRFYTRDGSTTAVRTVIDSDGRLKITKDAAPTLRIENTDASITTDQVIGDIDFYQSDPSGAGVGVVGRIRSINSDSSYQGQGSLAFHTGTSSSLTERFRVSSTGDVLIGRQTSGNTGGGHVIRGNDSAIFTRNSSNSASETVQISRHESDGMVVRLNTGSSGNGTQRGGIGVTTSGAMYFTAGNSTAEQLRVTSSGMQMASGKQIDLNGGAIFSKSFYFNGGGTQTVLTLAAGEVYVLVAKVYNYGGTDFRHGSIFYAARTQNGSPSTTTRGGYLASQQANSGFSISGADVRYSAGGGNPATTIMMLRIA